MGTGEGPPFGSGTLPTEDTEQDAQEKQHDVLADVQDALESDEMVVDEQQLDTMLKDELRKANGVAGHEVGEKAPLDVEALYREAEEHGPSVFVKALQGVGSYANATLSEAERQTLGEKYVEAVGPKKQLQVAYGFGDFVEVFPEAVRVEAAERWARTLTTSKKDVAALERFIAGEGIFVQRPDAAGAQLQARYETLSKGDNTSVSDNKEQATTQSGIAVDEKHGTESLENGTQADDLEAGLRAEAQRWEKKRVDSEEPDNLFHDQHKSPEDSESPAQTNVAVGKQSTSTPTEEGEKERSAKKTGSSKPAHLGGREKANKVRRTATIAAQNAASSGGQAAAEALSSVEEAMKGGEAHNEARPKEDVEANKEQKHMQAKHAREHVHKEHAETFQQIREQYKAEKAELETQRAAYYEAVEVYQAKKDELGFMGSLFGGLKEEGTVLERAAKTYRKFLGQVRTKNMFSGLQEEHEAVQESEEAYRAAQKQLGTRTKERREAFQKLRSTSNNERAQSDERLTEREVRLKNFYKGLQDQQVSNERALLDRLGSTAAEKELINNKYWDLVKQLGRSYASAPLRKKVLIGFATGVAVGAAAGALAGSATAVAAGSVAMGARRAAGVFAGSTVGVTAGAAVEGHLSEKVDEIDETVKEKIDESVHDVDADDYIEAQLNRMKWKKRGKAAAKGAGVATVVGTGVAAGAGTQAAFDAEVVGMAAGQELAAKMPDAPEVSDVPETPGIAEAGEGDVDALPEGVEEQSNVKFLTGEDRDRLLRRHAHNAATQRELSMLSAGTPADEIPTKELYQQELQRLQRPGALFDPARGLSEVEAAQLQKSAPAVAEKITVQEGTQYMTPEDVLGDQLDGERADGAEHKGGRRVMTPEEQKQRAEARQDLRDVISGKDAREALENSPDPEVSKARAQKLDTMMGEKQPHLEQNEMQLLPEEERNKLLQYHARVRAEAYANGMIQQGTDPQDVPSDALYQRELARLQEPGQVFYPGEGVSPTEASELSEHTEVQGEESDMDVEKLAPAATDTTAEAPREAEVPQSPRESVSNEEVHEAPEHRPHPEVSKARKAELDALLKVEDASTKDPATGEAFESTEFQSDDTSTSDESDDLFAMVNELYQGESGADTGPDTQTAEQVSEVHDDAPPMPDEVPEGDGAGAESIPEEPVPSAAVVAETTASNEALTTPERVELSGVYEKGSSVERELQQLLERNEWVQEQYPDLSAEERGKIAHTMRLELLQDPKNASGFNIRGGNPNNVWLGDSFKVEIPGDLMERHIEAVHVREVTEPVSPAAALAQAEVIDASEDIDTRQPNETLVAYDEGVQETRSSVRMHDIPNAVNANLEALSSAEIPDYHGEKTIGAFNFVWEALAEKGELSQNMLGRQAHFQSSWGPLSHVRIRDLYDAKPGVTYSIDDTELTLKPETELELRRIVDVARNLVEDDDVFTVAQQEDFTVGTFIESIRAQMDVEATDDVGAVSTGISPSTEATTLAGAETHTTQEGAGGYEIHVKEVELPEPGDVRVEATEAIEKLLEGKDFSAHETALLAFAHDNEFHDILQDKVRELADLQDTDMHVKIDWKDHYGALQPEEALAEIENCIMDTKLNGATSRTLLDKILGIHA